tara:strand:- start:86 stop:658 length:573 start_codon:yes stop_codon:yes gene_type:complete
MSSEINDAFNRIRSIAGDSNSIWVIYLRTLAMTRSLGDPFSMGKAQEAYNLYPDDTNIFQLYRILTYGQARVQEAEKLSLDAKSFYDQGKYLEAYELWKKAVDIDPLQKSHSLNAGLASFNLKNFNEAISFFNLARSSKDNNIVEQSIRITALAFISTGNNKRACAEFVKLISNYPKRMYQQEFNKYCRS